ncbi:MAG: glycosyltransferase, partial [Candidatus Hodarchaeota archaeon]
MKVVIVCWDFYRSSILRQPWRHVYEISKRMVKRGISTTIISNRDTNSQPQTEIIDGIPVHRISHRYLVLFFKRGQLLRTILKEKPDVIIWWGDPLSTIFLPLLKIG